MSEAVSGNGEDRARFPYLPLFVDDWLTSDAIDGFTVEQEGAYLRLLLRQWKSKTGMLPRDERELARISRLGERWRELGKPIIDRCFVKRRFGLVNLRLRNEWERAEKRSAVNANAARKRWSRK